MMQQFLIQIQSRRVSEVVTVRGQVMVRGGKFVGPPGQGRRVL